MAKVLIVDDSPHVRKVMRNMLTEVGHQIIAEATNAVEAIEEFKKVKPELVTIDLVMPELEGMNSIDAIKQMKKINPQVKIVVVSAAGNQHIIEEAINAGADGVVIKPFDPHKLVDTLRRVLR